MRKPLEAGREALKTCAALLLFAGCSQPRPRVAELRRDWTEAVNRGSTDWSNLSSNRMVEKYGPPDRVETLRLVWDRRGPWRRISVWDEREKFAGDGGLNNIEDTIAYPVPADKRGALAAFNLGLYVSPDGTELSARSSAEQRNFLMLNLADEIVKGLLSPKDARAAYARTLRLADAGKTSPSMERLLFR